MSEDDFKKRVEAVICKHFNRPSFDLVPLPRPTMNYDFYNKDEFYMGNMDLESRIERATDAWFIFRGEEIEEESLS
tara:strand:+ start:44 stop:271 length:228 start_codon:yes stop_codon:yes gene_type:complete